MLKCTAEVEPEPDYRIQLRLVLRFSLGPGSGPEVKNLGKTGPGAGVTSISAVAGVCVVVT